MPRTSNQKTGIAGEYFVAAELAQRGLDAGILLRNSESYDILCINPVSKKQFCIQVKTTWDKTVWPLNEKAETNFAPNHFYVFVTLFHDEARKPEYWIIPSETVALHVKEGHSDWLTTPGKNGQAHNDNPMRTLATKFIDPENKEFWNNWKVFNED